ncbi:hypothetical protein FIBSPDRAFT_738198, partial [Athelia psychrophila]
KGLYKSKIIQSSVNQVWFRNKKDEGVKYPEFYRPIPEVGLALILTAIECCIDEWASGTRDAIEFSADEYESKYHAHVSNLDRFEEHTKAYNILPKLLMDLHDNGRINAKADPIEEQASRAISPSAFDVAIEEFRSGAAESESEMEEEDY